MSQRTNKHLLGLQAILESTPGDTEGIGPFVPAPRAAPAAAATSGAAAVPTALNPSRDSHSSPFHGEIFPKSTREDLKPFPLVLAMEGRGHLGAFVSTRDSSTTQFWK